MGSYIAEQDPSAVDIAREAVVRRLGELLDGYEQRSVRIAVFGLNDIGRLAAQVIGQAGHQVCCFIDSFSNETVCDGLPVMKIEAALRHEAPGAVFLASFASADDLAHLLQQAVFQGDVLQLGEGFRAMCPSVLHPCSPRPVIESYRDKHHGETAYIIGNGSSLLRTDPRLLKGCLTFGGNGIHLLEDFEPSYYVAVDQRIDIWGDTVKNLTWMKFLAPHLSDIGGDAVFFPVFFEKDAPMEVNDIFRDGLETGHSIVCLMLQLAYYMGCQRAVLIGCDHNYKRREGHREGNREVELRQEQDPDVNHFNTNYIPADKVRSLKLSDGVEHMDRAYQRAGALYARSGRQIINATNGGKLECFPRADYAELLREMTCRDR